MLFFIIKMNSKNYVLYNINYSYDVLLVSIEITINSVIRKYFKSNHKNVIINVIFLSVIFPFFPIVCPRITHSHAKQLK